MRQREFGYPIQRFGWRERGLLAVRVDNVNPGVQNTIRLAIADAGDDVLDSGVFLAGGSFVNQPPSVVPDASSSLSLLGLGIGALALVKRRFV